MYLIVKTDGTRVALTDNLVYVKMTDNGCLNLADESSAQGVTYNGNLYNLVGHTEIKGAETVTVSEVDGGNILEKASMSTADNTEMLIDLQYQFDIASLGGM